MASLSRSEVPSLCLTRLVMGGNLYEALLLWIDQGGARTEYARTMRGLRASGPCTVPSWCYHSRWYMAPALWLVLSARSLGASGQTILPSGVVPHGSGFQWR